MRQRRALPSLGTLPDAAAILFIAGEHARGGIRFHASVGNKPLDSACMKTRTRRELYNESINEREELNRTIVYDILL